jgi:hypothetical protein
MEPDRFDDVELQVLEAPVARGPRRGTRWVIALVASVLTAGALAAGASALTGSDDDAAAARPAAKQRLHKVQGDAAFRAAHPCREHARTSTASAPLD